MISHREAVELKRMSQAGTIISDATVKQLVADFVELHEHCQKLIVIFRQTQLELTQSDEARAELSLQLIAHRQAALNGSKP
jgi:hypothetical protein